MAWTTEMIEHLSQMWQEGKTTNEIAKALGVSKNSIVGKVHRLNLEARPSPIKKKDEENMLEAENITPAQKEPEPKEPKITITPKKVSDAKVYHNTCIKLSELDNHTCRWPIGDPKDENFCFCGKKVRTGQTYCDEHAEIAYVKPLKKL